MTPQEALVAIARERDIDALVAQPEMLRGHLMDYCAGGNRREFNLLVYACHSRVPQVLRAPSSFVLQVDRIADLARRMVDDHGMADEHARWAVGTWALALGVSTAPVTDLRPSDPVRPPVPERVPDPAPVADPGRPTLVVDAGAVWGAYATIGEAIRASMVPGTLITVKPGIYREAVLIDRVVEIVGEGDRARIVVETTDATALTVTADRAVVRNLTVRAVGSGDRSGAVWVKHGRVVIEGCDLTSAIGAVVYITGKESAPVIRDCEIRDGQQCGVFVSEQGQGTIERCVISGNALAGVSIRTGGNPVIRGCEIRDGQASGVFVSEQGQGTIERCVISGNARAGVSIKTGGNPMLRDCEIRDGTGPGVFVYDQGQGMIEQCVISGNARAGVAIKTGGNPTVRDCQIRDGKDAGNPRQNARPSTTPEPTRSGGSPATPVQRTPIALDDRASDAQRRHMETLERQLTDTRTLKEKLRRIRAAQQKGNLPKPLPKFLEAVYQEWKSQTEKQVGQAGKIDLNTNLWDVTGEYTLFFLDILAFRDALDLLKELRADANQSALRHVFARLVNVLPTRLGATS